MGRMTEDDFRRARNLFDGELGKKLIAHAEAIELELKVSKEDEVEAVRKYGELAKSNERLIESVGELYKAKQELELTLQNSRSEVRRLMDEVDATRAAWLELEKQVPKKVVLPKEVAEAIEYYRSPQMDFTLQSFARIMFRFFENGDNQWTITLKNFVHKDGKGDVLMQALVNGYTVEQTKEERLREGIEKIIDESDMNPVTVAKQVAAYVTKFNAEN